MDSVHAKTADHGESDAPYCTTCHKAHQFNVKPTRAESVAVCIGCHSNEELMAKYGVSSTVVSTYLHDFHGKTAVLEGKENTTVDAAVCTDCHGVHAIKPIDSANSLTTLSGTSQVCQQCHPGKQESFASAFLRHSTPSPTKDVLIFIVDWFYRLMIPFVLIGLGIHIAFDVRQARKQKKGAHHGGSS
jgi:predicted CXXCH cytochrome family protein